MDGFYDVTLSCVPWSRYANKSGACGAKATCDWSSGWHGAPFCVSHDNESNSTSNMSLLAGAICRCLQGFERPAHSERLLAMTVSMSGVVSTHTNPSWINPVGMCWKHV